MKSISYLGLAAVILTAATAMTGTAREESWDDQQQYESRNRINHLIKGLDAPSRLRKPFVDELVSMADGKLRNLLLTQLIFGLNLHNDQITLGVVEIYSRINDPATIPILKGELLYNPALDVRRSVIQHLPGFYVTDAATRKEIIAFYEKAERYLPERLLSAMREPPFIAGSYSNVRDKLRREIETILSDQLEPVAAVMQGLETASYHKLAYAQLKNFLNLDLGHVKDKWKEFWSGRGQDFSSPLQSELFDTQINACRMLDDIGAEGTEELCARIRWIMGTPHKVVRTAALEMLGSLVEKAVAESRGQRIALQGVITRQAEKLWRQRRVEAAIRLQKLTLELAEQYLTGANNAFNLLLIDCLGQTRLPAAMPHLRTTLRSDNTSLEILTHVAGALGRIGDTEAVKLLVLMAEYQGIAVNREEQVREFQRVRAALRALGSITGEFVDGHFMVNDSEAAQQASNFLLSLLTDTRPVAGAPVEGRREILTVALLVRRILQEAWHINEISFAPERWQEHYAVLISESATMSAPNASKPKDSQ